VSDSIHPDDDRWLDLVQGLLPPDVRAATLSHAKHCALCAGRMRDVAATHERSLARPLRRRQSRALPAMIAAAAVVIAVAGIALLWTARGPAPLAPARLPSPDVGILTRSVPDATSDPALIAGLDAYRRSDYAAARRALGNARGTGPLEQVRRLYLGNAQLQLGDARGAVQTLRGVDRAFVPEPWVAELDWSLAVALATAGEHAEAESLRLVLSGRPDSIGTRARGTVFDAGRR
jgi:hypothetical protein